MSLVPETQWFPSLSARWNHLGSFEILNACIQPPDIVISVASSVAWELEFLKAPR